MKWNCLTLKWCPWAAAPNVCLWSCFKMLVHYCNSHLSIQCSLFYTKLESFPSTNTQKWLVQWPRTVNFVSELIELVTKSHCRQIQPQTWNRKSELKLRESMSKMKFGIVISAIVGGSLVNNFYCFVPSSNVRCCCSSNMLRRIMKFSWGEHLF